MTDNIFYVDVALTWHYYYTTLHLRAHFTYEVGKLENEWVPKDKIGLNSTVLSKWHRT